MSENLMTQKFLCHVVDKEIEKEKEKEAKQGTAEQGHLAKTDMTEGFGRRSAREGQAS